MAKERERCRRCGGRYTAGEYGEHTRGLMHSREIVLQAKLRRKGEKVAPIRRAEVPKPVTRAVPRVKEEALLKAAVEYLSRPGWGLLRGHKPLEEAVEAIAPGRIERARSTVKRKAEAAREAARWQGNPPAWAKRLIEKYTPSTQLTWRRSQTKGYSSGHCYGGHQIIVTAGAGWTKDADTEAEHKAVLLHEIAHALKPYAKHGDRFWDELYRLAKAEGHIRACESRSTYSFKAAARRARGKTTVKTNGGTAEWTGPNSLSDLLRL